MLVNENKWSRAPPCIDVLRTASSRDHSQNHIWLSIQHFRRSNGDTCLRLLSVIASYVICTSKGMGMSLQCMCCRGAFFNGSNNICRFIHHLQACLTVLTASRLMLLFNLQTCCLKPWVDAISSPDCLFFFCFTLLAPVSPPKPSAPQTSIKG